VSTPEVCIKEADEAAREIDEALLPFASAEARQEWQQLRARWPTVVAVAHQSAQAFDDELAVVLGKVQRFRSILLTYRAQSSSSAASGPTAPAPAAR
jgi:hypothetical protein